MINGLIRMFFRLVTPIQKLMQKLAKPEAKMTETHVTAMMGIIDEGMALFSKESMHITSFFIKGKWKHAALVVISEGRFYVVEAIGKGVIMLPLVEWLYKKDDVLLCDRVGYKREDRLKASAWAIEQTKSGKKYDYEFSGDNESFYCNELTADALDIPFKGISSPTELSLMSQYLKPVYDTTKGGYV